MFLSCVLLIHISGPKTEKTCSNVPQKHQWGNNSLNKLYQRRLVIAMKYNDEICDGQHTYNRKQIKKTRRMLNQNCVPITMNVNELFIIITISEFESSKIVQ